MQTLPPPQQSSNLPRLSEYPNTRALVATSVVVLGHRDRLDDSKVASGRGAAGDGDGARVLDTRADGALEHGVQGLQAGERGGGPRRHGDGHVRGEGRDGGQGDGRNVRGQRVRQRGQGARDRRQVAAERGDERGQVARQVRGDRAQIARERADQGREGGGRVEDGGQRDRGVRHRDGGERRGQRDEGVRHVDADGLRGRGRVPRAVGGVALSSAVVIIIAIVTVVSVRAAAAAIAWVVVGVAAAAVVVGARVKVGPVRSAAVVWRFASEEVGAISKASLGHLCNRGDGGSDGFNGL